MTEYNEPKEDTPEITPVGKIAEPHELIYDKQPPGDASFDV